MYSYKHRIAWTLISASFLENFSVYFRHVNTDSLLHYSWFTLGSTALLIIPPPFKTHLLYQSTLQFCLIKCLLSEISRHGFEPLPDTHVPRHFAGQCWLTVCACSATLRPFKLPGFLNQLLLNCSRSRGL